MKCTLLSSCSRNTDIVLKQFLDVLQVQFFLHSSNLKTFLMLAYILSLREINKSKGVILLFMPIFLAQCVLWCCYIVMENFHIFGHSRLPLGYDECS